MIAEASGRQRISARDLFDLRFSTVGADAVAEYRAQTARADASPASAQGQGARAP
jgi:hypothetical protein